MATVKQDVATLSLRRIVQLFAGHKTPRVSKDHITSRLSHCEYMHEQMASQALETGLNEYQRHALTFSSRIRFYKHVLASRSELVTEKYFINNEWMSF